MKKLITCEFVSCSHPDLIADSISDSIVDLALSKNKKARVAMETMVVGENVILGGELSGVSLSDKEINNAVIKIVKLNDSDGIKLLKPDNVKIQKFIRQQSQEISQGVDNDGAGDQGVMFGFSCNYNEDRLPMPLYFSRLVCLNIIHLNPLLFYKDCKSQFTVEYDDVTKQFGKIVNVVCSIHHSDSIGIREIRKTVKDFIINLIDKKYPEGDIKNAKFFINATGSFTSGGADADTGMTGRKLVCMGYGGMAHVGGGALSGKDSTKVDRSAAYFTRYVCNKIIKKGLANVIEIGVSYCIGIAEPMSVSIVQNDKPENEQEIIEYIKTFDFRPQSMIKELNLCNQKYVSSAMYGAFGKNPDGILYSWENV